MLARFKRKSPENEATTKEDLAMLTEEELGGRIAAIWEGCIDGIVSLLVDKPPVDQTIKDRVRGMKESAMETLVALGKAREARDTAKRAYVDLILTNRLGRANPATFKSYQGIVDHYRKIDKDLALEVSSFNIITQYANFDLLRRQALVEADRLGLS